MGSEIGADVNFFLADVPFAVCTNKGERVEPLDIKQVYTHYIVFPEVFSSTKAVYEGFGRALTSDFNNANILIHGLRKRDFLLIEKGIFNGLKASAFRVSPCLTKVEQQFKNLRAGMYGMTGSGSAFFLFDGGIVSKTALYRMCKSKGWKVFRVQTY